jgi:TPP-dependent pyruvate/acetoin dehydrogenase alpha subunit
MILVSLSLLEEGIIAEIREASIEEEVAPEVEVEVEASESSNPKKVIESHTVEHTFC